MCARLSVTDSRRKVIIVLVGRRMPPRHWTVLSMDTPAAGDGAAGRAGFRQVAGQRTCRDRGEHAFAWVTARTGWGATDAGIGGRDWP